ncbi:MAG: hypothetical protein VYD90_11195 [Pseudomonadota bacterium]|nr:hypothetical protein [Pseudomonadota bacterium]
MPTETLYAARNIDFAPTINVDYQGAELPLSGASVSMQVRQYPGAAGDPEAEDPDVAFTDAPHPDDPAWRRLVLEPRISRAALEAMPGQNQPDPGSPQTFVYEIKITYADMQQDSPLSGDFILAAGVDDT